MERRGENKIVWLCGKVQERMRWNEILRDITPMQDYIDAVWEETTKEFMRWYRVLVSLQGDMEIEGKEYHLQDKRKTY